MSGDKRLGPTLLRSQTRAALHASVQEGKLASDDARAIRPHRQPILRLGDGVLWRQA